MGLVLGNRCKSLGHSTCFHSSSPPGLLKIVHDSKAGKNSVVRYPYYNPGNVHVQTQMEYTLSLQLRRGCLFTRHIFERHHVFFTTDSGPITTEKMQKWIPKIVYSFSLIHVTCLQSNGLLFGSINIELFLWKRGRQCKLGTSLIWESENRFMSLFQH